MIFIIHIYDALAILKIRKLLEKKDWHYISLGVGSLNWRTFVYNYKKLQNYNSYTYCQFTYPIDAYAFENMIDGYEFTLIDNTAELQEIA